MLLSFLFQERVSNFAINMLLRQKEIYYRVNYGECIYWSSLVVEFSRVGLLVEASETAATREAASEARSAAERAMSLLADEGGSSLLATRE